MKCTIHNKANSTQSFEWIEDKFNHILDLGGLSIPSSLATHLGRRRMGGGRTMGPPQKGDGERERRPRSNNGPPPPPQTHSINLRRSSAWVVAHCSPPPHRSKCRHNGVCLHTKSNGEGKPEREGGEPKEEEKEEEEGGNCICQPKPLRSPRELAWGAQAHKNTTQQQ